MKIDNSKIRVGASNTPLSEGNGQGTGHEAEQSRAHLRNSKAGVVRVE